MSAAPSQRPPISRRAVAIGLALGAPCSGLFLYLAARGLDVGRLGAALASVRPLPLVLATLVMALLFGIQAERWRLIARREGTAPRHVFYAMVVGGLAVNNVVPGRPGELARAFWLSQRLRSPGARALATVVLDRACDLLTLLALLVVVIRFVPSTNWLRDLLLAAVAVGLAVVVGLAAAWWFARRRQRQSAPTGGGRLARLRRQGSEFVRGCATAMDTRTLPAIAGLSVCAWAAWALGAWLVADSLGMRLGVLEALVVTAVVNLGVVIPSSPGFVGTYQWLGVASLALFAVPRADAFAFSLLLQAVWYVPTTIAGLALGARMAWSLRRRLVEAPSVAEAAHR